MHTYKIYFGNGTTTMVKAKDRGEAVKIAVSTYGWIVTDVSFVK